MKTRNKIAAEADTYSTEYADYIMENCGGDRIICNGNTLTEAMESGYLWEDFIDSLFLSQ